MLYTKQEEKVSTIIPPQVKCIAIFEFPPLSMLSIFSRDWKRPVLNNHCIHILTLLFTFLQQLPAPMHCTRALTTASDICEIKTRRKQFVKMHHSWEMEDKGLQNAGEQERMLTTMEKSIMVSEKNIFLLEARGS